MRGGLRKRQGARKLLKGLREARGLTQVAVSIDSLRPEVYADLRGGARLHTALQTLEALRREHERAEPDLWLPRF